MGAEGAGQLRAARARSAPSRLDLHYGDEAGIAAVGAHGARSAAWASPTTSATPCLFLASPLARYVSGANLVVHGGGERPAFTEFMVGR